MNYQRIYDQIIERGRLSDRKKVKGGQYFENHHIIPVSMGGSNKKENLVLLTAREHYVCHKLLVEIYPDNSKLLYALWMFVNKTGVGRGYKVNSREYERTRILHSKNVSLNQSGENAAGYGIHRYGEESPRWMIPCTQEAKDKISVANTGKKRTKEHRDALSKAKMGHIGLHRPGNLNPNFGHTWNDEQKDNGRQYMLSLPQLECPHCSVVGSYVIMKRWHFDNCKQNPNYIDKRIELICEHCGFKSKHKSTMTQFHNNNCKHKPV